MFTFAEQTTLYRCTGLALLLIELNLFLAGMPPFQRGIWVQTEPAVLVMFTITALTGLWLTIGTWRRWLIPSPAFPPLIVCLLVWAAWQILVTFVVVMPWHSWFGPPQTGDGTCMSIAMILTIMLACPLWQAARYRHAIMSVVAVSLFVQCALHVYYPRTDDYIPERWVPAQWPEYLPFLGGYFWVAAFSGGYITNRIRYALLAVAMVALLVISLNKSAYGLFGVALLLTTLVPFVPLSRNLRRFFYPGPVWRKTMIVACVLPFSLVFISPVIPMLDASRDPTGIIALFSRINDGIGSRLALDQVGLATLQHEPGRLLIGAGWGGFNDDLFKYGLVDGVYTYINGVHKPNWFLVEGTSHHSHNQPLEALLSMGLVGLILWYAFPMLALWTFPKRWFWPCAPMIVALTGLGHFWFQLPQCFPAQAFYEAVLVSVCAKKLGPTLTFSRWWYGVACIVTVIAMAWSAVAQYTMMMHGDRVHDAALTKPYGDYTEEWVAADLAWGGDRWMATTRFYATDAPDKAKKENVSENMLGWYTYFIHTARKAAQTPQLGARIASMELRLLYSLFGGFDYALFDKLRHEATVSFEDAAIRMTAKAPLRDDYISFFMMNLPSYVHNDVAREIQILTRILAIAPDNRGALWLLGKIYLTTPGREEQGRSMLKKAITTHVEKVYPVTDAELSATIEKLIH